MKRRIVIAFAYLSCFAPIGVTAFDLHWLAPSRERELNACVGDYVLPSGLHYPVRRQGSDLTGGIPPAKLSRVANGLFANAALGTRASFQNSDGDEATALMLSGGLAGHACPRAKAESIDTAEHVIAAGCKLRIVNVGREHAGPTLILETGVLGSLEGIAGLQGDLAKFAHVVAYDHPGTGGSTRGSDSQNAKSVAHHLHAALATAGIEPPYVMMGISLGGPYSQVFAHEFPNDMAGLIWIDPTPEFEDLEAWCAEHKPGFYDKVRRALQWLDLSVETRLRELNEPGRIAEWNAMPETWQLVRDSWPLRRAPVLQITGAKDHETDDGVAAKVLYFSDWLVRHAPRHKHVLATESGHGVYGTESELVLGEIREFLDEIRAD